MKPAQILLTVLLSATVAFAVGRYAPAPSMQNETKKETAFERVMRTRTLRCAYVVRPPHILVDPNTKKISGIDHDIIEEIGKAAGLNIEWQEEVGYGVFPEHLNSGKQDAFCSLVLISARRAERVELSQAVTFLPLHVYTRAGEMRFDGNLSSINQPDVTIAVIDGSSQNAAVDSAFPNAKKFALPGDSDNSQTMLAVTTQKANAVVADDNTINDFNTRNQETLLRRVENLPPIRTYGEAFAFGKDETALRDLFNAAIQEMVGNGIVDRLISKYESTSGSILRTAKPYLPASPPAKSGETP